MKTHARQYAVIVLFFLIAVAVSWQLYLKEYTQRDTVNIHLFPAQIGEWKSKELTITDEEYDILETRNAFVRDYENPAGHHAYLFIVYSQTNRKVSHPPEVCYIGSGVAVLEKSPNTIPLESQNLLLEVNQLLMEKGTAKHLAFYWFKVGTSYTASYWKQQMLIVLKTLFGQPSSSALIRVSADIAGDEQTKATEDLKEFTHLIAPYLSQYLP